MQLESSVPADGPTAPRLTIGVMGQAGGQLTERQVQLAYELGRAIALAGCTLINGACPGLPYYAAAGAKAEGGLTVGISPALSLQEHLENYGSPTEHLDVIIYTGSGLMGREVTNIRSSDLVVIIGGRSGTLGEFSIAYDEGKLIGVVDGSNGITAALPEIIELCKKDSGATVIFDRDPQTLIARLLSYYHEEHYKHPSCFSPATYPAEA